MPVVPSLSRYSSSPSSQCPIRVSGSFFVVVMTLAQYYSLACIVSVRIQGEGQNQSRVGLVLPLKYETFCCFFYSIGGHYTFPLEFV